MNNDPALMITDNETLKTVVLTLCNNTFYAYFT